MSLDSADSARPPSSPARRCWNSCSPRSQRRRPHGTAQDPRPKAEKSLRHTLDAMAHGGIRDQLGGGFHRYSTDGNWLVPHFEIMLYDNAMLGWVYAEAFRQFGDRTYGEIARGIFDFILREMTSPQGAFYTAFDAEVDAQEGMPTCGQKRRSRRSSALRMRHGSITSMGLTWARTSPTRITARERPTRIFSIWLIPATAMRLPCLTQNFALLRQKLYDARRQRKQPLLDTKILTSWNALMIRALAYGGQVLAHRQYIQAAEKAATFLLSHHRHQSNGGLYRTSRDGAAKYNGFLDDYAFLTQALLTLAQATGESRWVDEASAIAKIMLEKFGDDEAGGLYFSDRDATDLVVRQMTATDSPLPSGNAVAAMALLELGKIDESRNLLSTFAGPLDSHGGGMSSMVQAALGYVTQQGPFQVSTAPQDAEPDRPLPPTKIAQGVVAFKPHWATPTDLHLRLSILKGFHINAHDPQSGEVPLIPTNLTVTDSYGAPADVTIDYPPGEEQAFGFTDKPIRVYSGDVVLALRFKAVMVGAGPLQLSLSYQPCDESACLPPVTKTVEVKAR